MSELRPDDRPQPGDILLFTQANRIKLLVTWFTYSRYYHVGIYEGNNHTIEARVNGVIRRDISEKGYAVRVIPMPEQGREQVLEYARTCIGRRYDVFGVLIVLMREYLPQVRVRYRSGDKLTCGEFVTRAWRHAGLDLFPGRSAERIVPADFQQFLPVDSHDTMLWKVPFRRDE